jgi:hypothetical protein
MDRPMNGTLRVLGLALGVLVVVGGAAMAWGHLGATQADHERRLLAVERTVQKIEPMYWLVRQIAARDGIELPKE